MTRTPPRFPLAKHSPTDLAHAARSWHNSACFGMIQQETLPADILIFGQIGVNQFGKERCLDKLHSRIIRQRRIAAKRNHRRQCELRPAPVGNIILIASAQGDLMPGITFTIVDVFAESKYAGNQLAVFRGPVPEALMQPIAQEMHYSETTFITSDTPRNGGYDVRIFHPGSEGPFAGHPTLGTAHLLPTQVAAGQPRGQPDDVALHLPGGPIPAHFNGNYSK